MSAAWNNILHTALLGTDKQPLRPEELGEDLASIAEQIQEVTQDKEEIFLQIAALAFNCRQAGFAPLHKESAQHSRPEAEDKPYCNPQAMQALTDILTEENTSLLTFWLQRCREHGELAPPEILPTLLQLAQTNKHLRDDILICGGQRARWLAMLNPEWSRLPGSDETGEQLWQTGTPEQRREVLQQLHISDPAKAQDWLQATWAQEDINSKVDLLRALSANPDAADLPFLESLSGDKSKKIREEVTRLLKKIPTSTLIKQYGEALQQRLKLKKEKSLLGMLSKTSLEIVPPASGQELSPILLQSGIEKLSNNKGYSDDEFICYQLMSFIPLDFYATLWQKTPEEVVKLFNDDPLGKKLIPALVLSTVHFAEPKYAVPLMQFSSTFYLDLLPMLQPQQQEYYSNKFFATSPDAIIQYSTRRQTEWGLELTESILSHASKDSYRYNRVFFNNVITLMPTGAASVLDKVQLQSSLLSTGGVSNWASIGDLIRKLLQLKTQTILAFNK
jgi:hypothetical protein